MRRARLRRAGWRVLAWFTLIVALAAVWAWARPSRPATAIESATSAWGEASRRLP